MTRLRRLVSYKPLFKAAVKAKVRDVGIEECFEDIFGSIRRLVDVPSTLMMLLGVLVICLTHTDDLSEGFIKDLIDKYPDNRLLLFIKSNFKQTLGFIMFIVVITDLPRSMNRVLAFVGAAVWVYALPPYNIYQYACHALIAHSYFRVSKRKSKAVLLVIAAVVFLFGHNYLGTLPHPMLPPEPPAITSTSAAPKKIQKL